MYREPDRICDLASRASAGDLDAQAALCQHYEREVRIASRVFLGSQLRPHLDSVDVAQSVHKSILAKLIEGKLVIHDSRRLIALACLIARRKIAKKWRKVRRQERLPELQSQLIPASNSHTGNSSAAENQLAMKLAAIRESVSEGERQLIDLRLAGLTTEQIARQLKIEPVALRVRWSRLCAKIRKSSSLGEDSTTEG